MPLLFAATLFVSASLLFMVQPMVGKLVLPLLGGSPAVWNACMVFFQALLLFGYFYADRLTRIPSARKQSMIHMGVMVLPVTVFVLAVLFDGQPIAIVESLAPSGETSAVLSVLAILTVAIGIPFFVVSTSATLLQKWFTYTGHPSARDPYFLYAASNLGSLISLLGYPIFIEPNMTQGAQTWFWAVGFVGLFALIVVCGRAASNPLGVPPGAKLATVNVGATAAKGGKQGGGAGAANALAAAQAPAEPPPSWMRMAKWTVLAFVPSSLMLGVTFHMTTDIASIPLLWVGPLALYLITFIIAFGRTPPWFRILIGNLAPVMILLLVFVMTSAVPIGTGLKLLLHLLTFFAAALMCHYELARDRPSPQYLTTYFLIMSFGGVCGGIFNSLVAPVVFTHTYEYPLALIIACLMIPPLLTADEAAATAAKWNRPWAGGLVGEDDILPIAIGSGIVALVALLVTLPVYSAATSLPIALGAALAYNALYLFAWRPLRAAYLTLPSDTRWWIALALDIVIPILLGVAFWQLQKLEVAWRIGTLSQTSEWYSKWLSGISGAFPKLKFLSERTIVTVVTFALPVMICFFFVDRPLRFALAVAAVLGQWYYKDAGADAIYAERSFFGILKIEETASRQFLLDRTTEDQRVVRWPDGRPILMGEYDYCRLVHGTTLHGTQVSRHDRHILDDFQFLTAANPWDNLAVLGAIQTFDMKQEPLTYYHRTGPVGAMFDELKRRGKEKEHVAMVGLGTGSVSCYAQKGQRLTYYEIDPAVRRLVEKPWMVMNEKELRDRGSAPIADPEVRQLVEKLSGVTIHDQASYDEKVRAYKEQLRAYQPVLQQYYAEVARRKAAGEPPPESAPEEPAKPPATPEIGPFTYVEDSRKRGANVDFRMGDARLKLKETDDKYALLLVDAFSSDAIPVHLLTVEAVQLYLDRLTDDGILALHISNKFVRLEPVVYAIAEKHNLVARIWNDDSEGKHGKTASSWVVLARHRDHLGPRLCSPISDYMDEFYHGAQLVDVIQRKYPALKPALSKATGKQQEALLAWLDERTADPQAATFARWIRKYGTEYITLMAILQNETGYGFRTLDGLKGVDPWTDDYADVMRVMMIPELQAVRKFFGLPTPVER